MIGSDSLQAAEFVADTVSDALSPGLMTWQGAEEPGWASGIEPVERPQSGARQPVLILSVVLLLLMLLYNISSLRQLLRFNVDEIVNVRHGRDNVFDERPAAARGLQSLLTALLVVAGGFLLCVGIFGDSALLTTSAIAIGVGAVGAYYVFCRVAYFTVGFTFSTPEGCREWLRGFSASIALLAVSLALPAVAAIVVPSCSSFMAVLALILFFFAKITFIFKGFRIFFDNFFSLVYFILYLCTLEIIPIILVYKFTVDLVA